MKDLRIPCGMWLFVMIAMLVVLAFSVKSCKVAEAQVIDAKANYVWQEGRADAERMAGRAAAFATQSAAVALTLAAVTPAYVTSLVFLVVLGIIALAMVITVKAKPNTETRTITREIVYLPPPGQSRRETWQALSAGNVIEIEHKPLMIEAKHATRAASVKKGK